MTKLLMRGAPTETMTSLVSTKNLFIGRDVYAQYGKGEPFSISLGIKASFLPLRKVDTLNSIPIYQNYLLPYVAFRLKIRRDDKPLK